MRQLLCFPLGTEDYGIDLACVHAIAAVEELHSVPGTPPFLRGVIPSALGPVPLVDLARKFELGSAALPPRPTAAIVRTPVAGRTSAMAILIGESSRIEELGPGAIEPAPELSSGIRAEFLLGVAKLEGRSVLALDLGLSLSATEAQALEGLGEDDRARATIESDPLEPWIDEMAPGADSFGSEHEHLVFSVSGVTAAFRLTEITELVQLGPVMPLPGVPPWVTGVTNLRGDVIPVLDTAAILGLPSAPPTARSCGIVASVELAERPAAVVFVVDDVLQVVTPGPGDLDLPASLGLPFPVEHVRGVTRCDRGFAVLLSPSTLVPGALTSAGGRPTTAVQRPRETASPAP